MEKPVYVYVIEAVGLGYFKVGLAVDPFQRLKELQTGCPKPLRLVACFDPRPVRASDMERKAHEVLARYRSHGEWFEVDAPFYSHVRLALQNLLMAHQDSLGRRESAKARPEEIPF